MNAKQPSTRRALERYEDARKAGRLTGLLAYYQADTHQGPSAIYIEDAGHAWLWLRQRTRRTIIGAWTVGGFDLEA